MNGSVGLKVVGVKLPGRGPFAMSSSRWFCQKQRANATPKTARETMILVRSSSRCSTRVSRSSWETALMRAIGAPPSGALVGDYLALDRLDRLNRIGLRVRLRAGQLRAL